MEDLILRKDGREDSENLSHDLVQRMPERGNDRSVEESTFRQDGCIDTGSLLQGQFPTILECEYDHSLVELESIFRHLPTKPERDHERSVEVVSLFDNIVSDQRRHLENISGV